MPPPAGWTSWSQGAEDLAINSVQQNFAWYQDMQNEGWVMVVQTTGQHDESGQRIVRYIMTTTDQLRKFRPITPGGECYRVVAQNGWVYKTPN